MILFLFDRKLCVAGATRSHYARACRVVVVLGLFCIKLDIITFFLIHHKAKF
jgi:hypothetical protein